MENEDQKIRDLLENWGNRAVVAIDSHYFCSRYYAKRHYWLGIPTILLSAIVGSSIFSIAEFQTPNHLRISLGSLSVLAAVLSSLQTFFRYSERSETHKSTASRYSSIKREIEQLLISPDLSFKEVKKDVDSIRNKLDDLSFSSPRIPDGVWENARIRHGRSVTNNQQRNS